MERKILTIDGGGIKGAFAAAFFAEVEESLGERVASYFDLIVGTSTGGILALGLGLGLSARDLLEFYVQLGPRVFERNSHLVPRRLQGLIFAKYDPGPLRHALEATFGDRKLSESSVRLVVPSLSLETGRVYLYKTAHHPKLERDYLESVVEVAMATSAAPSYFPTHRSARGVPLVDGGMWANNPTGLAVVEAIGVLNWPRETLNVLSIGCISDPLSVTQAKSRSRGKLYWASKIAEVFMAGQCSSSLSTAEVLIGKENLTRVSPRVATGRFRLDGIQELESLVGLGAEEGRRALPELRRRFLTSKAEPFEPCHQLATHASRTLKAL